jgi:alkylhydroperoxidase family enzyme
MNTTLKRYAAIAVLLLAASPAHAGPCTNTIANVQAQVDAAIENRAGSDRWKRESLKALRGYQPTPRSLAASEGSDGAVFEYALDALDRARAADRAADSATCHREIANARAALRQ